MHYLYMHLRSSLEKHGRCGDPVKMGVQPPGSLTCRGSCSELALGLLRTWGILDMKWEGCSSVSDTFHGAEVAAFWPPELRSSIRAKLLGCHGICLVAQLRPGLSQVLVVQFSCAGRQSLPPTWKLGDANLCQLGHGGFCVPGSESLVDQAAMWGYIMTKWKLGFQLVSVFLHFFPGSLGIVSASK